MPPLSTTALRTQLASGETASIYVLVGADEAEKHAVANEFVESVDEGLRAFNVEKFYGAETSVDDLIDAASTFPMMAPRRVVVVLAAEQLLVPKRESKAAEAALERLQAFVEQPPAHATLVLVCGNLDRRRRLVKRLLESAHVVDCGTIADAQDAVRWVQRRAAQGGVPLEPEAVHALVDRCGTDIVRLRAGLERVSLYGLGQRTLTATDVRDSVPAGPEAHQDFGVANAIKDGDAARALREVGLAIDAGQIPFVLMGQIRWAAEKLPSAQVPRAIDAVLRTDLALKSSGGDARFLLERLVVELCGTPGRPAARRPYR